MVGIWKGVIRRGILLASLSLALAVLPARSQEPASGPTAAPRPVVHALLFYSPTCPHCHRLISEYLIPLQEEYGDRLVILGFDTSQGWAQDLYWKTLRYFEVPERDWAVPLMVVADEVLVGGDEIPAGFPRYLERGLEGEGVDLPDFPALLAFLEEQDLLDPRFPDRRVVRQTSPSATTEDRPTEAPATEAPATEAPGADAVAEIPEDSVPAAGETGGAPATQAIGAGEAREGAGGGDTTRAHPEPPVSDSLLTDSLEGGALTPESEREPPSPEPEEEEAADTARDATSASPGGAASSRTGRRPLEMTDAARELRSMSMADRFLQDSTGNSLAVLVLVVLLATLLLRGYPPRTAGGVWPAWVVPLLLVVGLGVASYLSYVEVSRVEAVCGPVGDCNTVNQSEYARLFGMLPVGILGVMGYLFMFAVWLLGRFGGRRIGPLASLAFWAAALAGTLFSVYLTFLEPFVIGASCAWCLTSAVIMALLLWAAAPMAARVWPGGEARI